MRKFFALILILALTPCTCLAWGKKDKPDTEGKGYMGTLPDVSKSFGTNDPAQAKPMFEPTETFHSENDIKPAPRDNPAFVNIILKTDKTSPYLNDINDMIPLLEKMLDSIETKENIQKFVAKTYFFNRNCDYLRDKYTNKPEESYISFRKLMELSLHTQAVTTLRVEAEKYNPYLAYGGAGYIYNVQNIDEQLEYLKAEIEQTIVVLKDAN
ncbi:MAG: hypothetical protein LBJ74_02540 [Heliobacteriaceae bacterium]|jgi:hypothetical protein|nr:hypothetical protein [Heliobacteriaceae bacterium]